MWALAATSRDTGVRAEFTDAWFQDRLMSIKLERAVHHHHGSGYLGEQFKGKRILVHCDQHIHHADHGQGFLQEQVYDGSGLLTGHVWHTVQF